MKKLLLIFAFSFLIFYPALFGFYTNDDFFCLRISHFRNLGDFANSFNITKGPDGWGLYRPLTVQVFYSLAWTIFNLNPLYLHILSFGLFFLLIFLVYKLILLISGSEKASLIASFLYAVSATHFGHLYFLSTQELGLAVFVLLSVIYGLRFFRERKKQYYLFSFLAFVLSLFSKETAVVTPFLLAAVVFFDYRAGKNNTSLKTLVYYLLPFLAVLSVYFYFRFFHYGFAAGDSYVWNFSIKRLANTLVWYLTWSLNLPETLVDFVGPGLHVNPNLWLYWSKQIIPILVLFTVQICLIVYVFIRSKFSLIANRRTLFATLWFLISLLPVVFLPLHKFTFYLTLPLIGVVFFLSYLFINHKSLTVTFCIVWTVLSILTLKHTVNTSWITQGQNTAKRVYEYFLTKKDEIGSRAIYLIDTERDANLPWSPTTVVKTALSDKNFFLVYFPDMAGRINYTGDQKLSNRENAYIIESRIFLGY